MTTKIILVRHGESLGNAKGMYIGHLNYGLSDFGRQQAQATANHLKDVKIDAIYSSDLLRAHDTAVPHAKIRNMNIVDREELREVNIGEWEGKKIEDLIKNHYDEFVIGWKQNFGTFAFPGGESVLAAADRFYNEVLKIANSHPGECVLITAHAAIIRAFWCKVLSIAPADMARSVPFPTNASYSILEFDGASFLPKEYAHDEHLLTLNSGKNVNNV